MFNNDPFINWSQFLGKLGILRLFMTRFRVFDKCVGQSSSLPMRYAHDKQIV